MNIIFFRNDDVRNSLDKPLIDITDIFIKNKIPIIHAVEPANITPGVVDWLLEKRNSYPEIISIMQHGYDHKVKNNVKKGEFGGQRTYDEQYQDISAGKKLMNEYFGDKWFEAINFPYAPYNPSTTKAADDCGYKVLNSHYNCGWDRKFFYFLGHLLKKGFWLNHHVSWNLHYYPGTKMFEIDMNVSFIKKYINEETDSIMLTIEEMKEKTLQYSKSKTTGVLLHHRYHNNEEKIELVQEYIQWCKEMKFTFMSMEGIYDKFCK